MSRLDAYDVQVILEEEERWVIFVGAREWRCCDAGGGRLVDAGAYPTQHAEAPIFSIWSA
jgi:hypothetical protein